MNENETFDEEELRQLVLDAITTKYSVEDAIKLKTEEDDTKNESFDLTYKYHSNVYKENNKLLIKLKIMRFQISVLKLYSYIFNNEQYDLVCGVSDKITETEKEFKDLKELLQEIKNGINMLRFKGTAVCNGSICNLDSYIFDKGELLIDELNVYIKSAQMSIKGIQYMSTNKNQEKLKELNKTIDNSTKILGLDK